MNYQREKLLEFERTLGIGAVEAAELLSHPEKITPYGTYKGWKNGRAPMPGVAWLIVDRLISEKLAEL
jgi:hypothetical protein